MAMIELECPNCSKCFVGWSGHNRIFCSWKCRYAYARQPEVIKRRFWENVDVKEKNQCWIWTGDFFVTGYGQFSFVLKIKAHKVKANRFAWILTHGKIPDGLEVCHSCDIPACVNPNHLWLGTHQENMDDMVWKGRQNLGERNGKHILIESEVLEVYNLRKLGWKQQDIADKFNVSRTCVLLILNGTNWKYLFQANMLNVVTTDHRFKLIESDVLEIHDLHKLGWSLGKIAEKFNVSNASVSLIVNGKTWKHLLPI